MTRSTTTATTTARWRTRLAAAAAALAATGATIGAAPASAAVEPLVPTSCNVTSSAFGADGRGRFYTYLGASGPSTTLFNTPSFGFVPKAFDNWASAGSETGSQARDWAVHPTTGVLYDVTEKSQLRPDGTWSFTVSKKQVGTGWAGVRDLTTGTTPYLYALSGGGLYRYSFSDTGVRSAGNAGTTGWGSVSTMSWTRSVTLGTKADGTPRTADVLLATDTAQGRLLQYTVPHDTPTKWTRVVLGTGGWGSFTSLSQGWCGSNANTRAYLGIKANGDAYAYYDPNITDASGSGIRGGKVKVATGWTLTSYSGR